MRHEGGTISAEEIAWRDAQRMRNLGHLLGPGSAIQLFGRDGARRERRLQQRLSGVETTVRVNRLLIPGYEIAFRGEMTRGARAPRWR